MATTPSSHISPIPSRDQTCIRPVGTLQYEDCDLCAVVSRGLTRIAYRYSRTIIQHSPIHFALFYHIDVLREHTEPS